MRPSCAETYPGPPGSVATAGPPAAAMGAPEKSIVKSANGAGADGAATPLSPEKSMAMPPKGTDGTTGRSSPEVSVGAVADVPFRASLDSCAGFDETS